MKEIKWFKRIEYNMKARKIGINEEKCEKKMFNI